jgi:unsaturated rhamnogalacturonyl hydrolase
MNARSALRLIAPALIATSVCTQAAQPACFAEWPDGKSPAVVGKRLIENFLPRKFRYETVPAKAKLGVIYPEVITWYGALSVAELTHDNDLRGQLVKKFDFYLSEDGAKHINPDAHVDFRVFGIVPLEIHLLTKDPRCLELGRRCADLQWSTTTPDGITTEARYWIDDMYMIPALQAQAFRATRDAVYLDRAALAMASYLDRLQQPNGLFHHGADSPFFWSRGNGWMAAGAAELLRDLPATHPRRERILAGYRTMMKSLLAFQTPEGLWRQLVDKPESWPESSGSAMFAFGMVTGVKQGWLDEATYGPASRKAWLALTGLLDENANLKEVCIGTNKGMDEPYYLARPRVAGDFHGQAPMLWTAAALLR